MSWTIQNKLKKYSIIYKYVYLINISNVYYIDISYVYYNILYVLFRVFNASREMRERTVPAARSTHPERMSSFLRLNQNSKINGAVISGHYCPQIVKWVTLPNIGPISWILQKGDPKQHVVTACNSQRRLQLTLCHEWLPGSVKAPATRGHSVVQGGPKGTERRLAFVVNICDVV